MTCGRFEILVDLLNELELSKVLSVHRPNCRPLPYCGIELLMTSIDRADWYDIFLKPTGYPGNRRPKKRLMYHNGELPQITGSISTPLKKGVKCQSLNLANGNSISNNTVY